MSNFKRKSIGELVIACENLNFVWKSAEVESFREMWKEGWVVSDIAKRLSRQEDEVRILVIDQIRGRVIQKRKENHFRDTGIY
ncbi:helix-turn-helix domain containing protein [Paenibacillaceae bacterium]|nr:helix-turn-helix domain containing protein [Paenibacillaceae bacterium]